MTRVPFSSGQPSRTPEAGRLLAGRHIPLPEVCAECEVAPARVRHHWDGDARNNVNNVVGVCHRCHERLHGRLEATRARSRANLAALAAAKAARTHCAKGHEFTPENTYTKPTGARLCRTCHILARRARRARTGEDDLTERAIEEANSAWAETQTAIDAAHGM